MQGVNRDIDEGWMWYEIEDAVGEREGKMGDKIENEFKREMECRMEVCLIHQSGDARDVVIYHNISYIG